MTTKPITCRGSELFEVLTDLRKRGFTPWALDAKVGSPSGWRVSYFAGAAVVPHDTVERQLKRVGGVNPPACTILDRPGGVKSADLGRRDDLSAEARLAALEAKLRAEGRLKNPRRRVGQGEGGAGIESSIVPPILPHRALGHDVACDNPPSVQSEARLPYAD